ncbi:MAG: DUF4349 domain-containing protein [Gemmatimonadaceae bacterium]|nr:DUF4349 domain-containing protein [Gemmatimonadaceae bacterium]
MSRWTMSSRSRSGRVLWLVAGLAACSRGAADRQDGAVADGAVPAVAPAPEAPAMAGDAAVSAEATMPAPLSRAKLVATVAAGGAATAVTGVAEPARMIVRTARLSMQVADVRRAVQEVTAMTGGVKGFVGDARLWRDGEADRASLTLRVPSDVLDATLGRLRGLAVRVDDESMSGEDVTRQAVDLGAQLTNLRATEAELRALLTTVRLNAKRAADVLEVHQELSRIRGEIEQRTAELQSITQLAAMSTIALEIRPDVGAVPVADGGWQPKGVLREAMRALLATGHVLVDGVIWAVVYAAPLLLLAGGVLLAVRRGWRVLRRRGAPVAPAAG